LTCRSTKAAEHFGRTQGEQKHEDVEVYRAERFFGRFQRTVTVPASVAVDKVKAQYQRRHPDHHAAQDGGSEAEHIDVNVS